MLVGTNPANLLEVGFWTRIGLGREGFPNYFRVADHRTRNPGQLDPRLHSGAL